MYVLWFITAQQVRFAIPVLTLITLAAIIGIGQLSPSAQRAASVVGVLLALFSLPWTNLGYYLDSRLCVLKIRTPIDYIRDGVGDSYAELALQLQATNKPDDKVISLFEHRLAYLPRGIEIATPYFQTKYFVDAANHSSADEIHRALVENLISKVVFALTPMGPDVSPSCIELQQVWFP